MAALTRAQLDVTSAEYAGPVASSLASFLWLGLTRNLTFVQGSSSNPSLLILANSVSIQVPILYCTTLEVMATHQGLTEIKRKLVDDLCRDWTVNLV